MIRFARVLAPLSHTPGRCFPKERKEQKINVCVQANAIKEVDCTSMAALTAYALQLFLGQHSDF